MKLLVVGGGGREHALAWKLAQSTRVQCVYVAPGNGGTARDPRLRNVPFTGPQELADFVRSERIALTVVGPEAPLAAGLVDVFRSQGLRIVGPTQAAAQLESSKAFAKAFMERHGIPTATYAVFTKAAEAHAYVRAQGAPIVVKADGLAAGKGVVVALTTEQAHAAIDACFGPAGAEASGEGKARVVIEEFMEGEEASFIVLCDGKNVLPLATSQDHKRLLDDDQGPNTGGMGAVSPAAVVTPNVHARVMHEIILPTIAGMQAEGTPFTGFLYAGLMIDARGQPRTVEFNCRLGDPEAQVLLMRLKSDLLDALLHAADGTLDQVELEWHRQACVGVVVAAPGYPSAPRSGDPIAGLPADSEDAVVFHAATTLSEAGLHSNGGRVLCATALGVSVKQAQTRAYALLGRLTLDGAQWRRDIGHRAIKR